MRVLVTQAIASEALAILEKSGVEVDLRVGDGPMPRAELLDRVRGCDGILCMLTDRIDGELLDAGPVRAVSNHAVGYDNVDVEAARARGVSVAFTPGILTEASADFAMALILAVTRRVVEGDRLARSGTWAGWRPLELLGLELQGARLGIVGMGRIGRAVARRAEAFGMEVVGTRRRSGLPLDALLRTSDVVSLHCPLTPETHHLVDAAALARMRPGSYLVNTARGPVVDEDALVAALERGHLAGAALDVHEHEPAVHPGLRALDNVVLAPHIASAGHDTRRRAGLLAARALVAGLRGEPWEHRVA